VPETLPCYQCVDLSGAPVDAALRWLRVPGDDGVEQERWGSAVGPAVFQGLPRLVPAQAPPVSRVALVTWNVRVGAGALRPFIRQLRNGRFTGGRPVEHFLLLLQEVHRAAREIPDPPPPESATARRIAEPPPAGGRREDIVRVAREEEAALLYLPSMRNGTAADPPPHEDRGNAVLSTLPLLDPFAVELPLERQRRVAAGVGVELAAQEGGTPMRFLALTLHLENRAPWRSVHRRSPVAARETQARGLLEVVPLGGPSIVGGDLNSWWREQEEPAVRLIRERLPHPATLETLPTHHWELGLDRQSDYLLYRLPEGLTGSTRRLESEWGSDHWPLLGTITAVGGTTPEKAFS